MRERGLQGHQAVAALRRSQSEDGKLPARAPNGSVSPLLWSMHGMAALAGVMLYDNTLALILLCVVFGVVYVLLHRKLDETRDRLPLAGLREVQDLAAFDQPEIAGHAVIVPVRTDTVRPCRGLAAGETYDRVDAGLAGGLFDQRRERCGQRPLACRCELGLAMFKTGHGGS